MSEWSQDTEDFLSILLDTSALGALSFYGKHPDMKSLVHQRFSTVAGLSNFVAEYDLGTSQWDFFVCPNSHAANGKPRIVDMTSLDWMVIDLDPITEGASAEDPDLPIIIDNLMPADEPQYGLPQATVISTGRGLQLWYRVTDFQLGDALLAFRAVKARLGAATQPLADLGWAIDPTCFDWAHIFRVPGTINRKNGRRAEVIRLVRYPQAINPWALPDPGPPAQAAAGPLTDASTLSILCALSPQARSFISYGAITGVESRHRQAFIAIAQLHELGVPKDTACALVSTGASRCSPPLTDWETTVSRVYART